MIRNRWYIFGVDWGILTKNKGKAYVTCASRSFPSACLEWIPPSTEKKYYNDSFLQYVVITDRQVCKVKKEEVWLIPMTKAPTPTEKSKKQRENTITPQKMSITQRLRTDLGRSVGVTIAT